jgi:hypothetical protein
MKPIEKDELYEHVSGFLKNRGVEMKEGTYTKGIQTGCTLLADAINLSQSGIERARVEIEKKLDQMRQVIHESTAPRSSAESPPSPAAARPSPARPKKSKNQSPKPKGSAQKSKSAQAGSQAPRKKR